jgi:hypothetical protein
MDTPIIDASMRAAIAPGGNVEDVCIRFLRAALPWEPPAERLKATIKAGCIGGRANCRYPSCDCETYPETVIAAYRNQPIMRELYPEQFSRPERKITVTSTGYDPAIGRAVRDPTLEQSDG